jgi:hypothetical protein
LDKTKHAEVYSKACYLICDLFLKDNIIENMNSERDTTNKNNNKNNNNNKTTTTSKSSHHHSSTFEKKSTNETSISVTPTLELDSLIGKENNKHKKYDNDKNENNENKSDIDDIETLTADSTVEEKSKFCIKYLALVKIKIEN